jgi:hypothetical protein
MRRIQEESAALKALLSSASLIVLHFCTFVRLVTADHATCRRSKHSMVSGEMGAPRQRSRDQSPLLGSNRGAHARPRAPTEKLWPKNASRIFTA